MGSAPRLFRILEALAAQEVEFILVGGMAAILEGAPISTFDLDIVFRKTEENEKRLLAALQKLGARNLDPAGRDLSPDATKVATLRLHRLITPHGPVDVMETIGHGLRYEDLVADTKVSEVDGMAIRILGLKSIILSKEQADRDKDKATLPLLRRTLRLRSEKGGEE